MTNAERRAAARWAVAEWISISSKNPGAVLSLISDLKREDRAAMQLEVAALMDRLLNQENLRELRDEVQANREREGL